MKNHETRTTMDTMGEQQLQPAPKSNSDNGKRTPWRKRASRATVALAAVIATIGGSYYGWTAWKENGNAAARYNTPVVQRGVNE